MKITLLFVKNPKMCIKITQLQSKTFIKIIQTHAFIYLFMMIVTLIL